MRQFGWRPARGLLGAVVLLAVLQAGCGGPGWLKTYPVKGVVRVDGKAAKGVFVTFHPRERVGERPYIPSGQTDENGEFKLSTFETGDGAPPGEYDVTVTWPVRFNPISTHWEGDQLNGRYAKKEDSAIRITVEKKPQELAPIEVSTSGK